MIATTWEIPREVARVGECKCKWKGRWVIRMQTGRLAAINPELYR